MRDIAEYPSDVRQKLDTLRETLAQIIPVVSALLKMDDLDDEDRALAIITVEAAWLLAERNMPADSRTDLSGVHLRRYARIIERAHEQARATAIAAVRANRLSRVQASKILGVHQATIARWVNEAS